MATLAFKPYTYKPTPRSTSTATRHRPAPKQDNMLDNLQQIKSSGVSVSTLRPAAAAAADSDGGYRPGIRGTGTIYGGSDKVNDDESDDDRDLPTLEELLFTKLQAQGFTRRDRGPDKTSEVEEVSADEKGSSIDQTRSAQSDNSSKSPDDPIVLLVDSNSGASEAEAREVILRVESAIASGAGLFDSPETAIDLTTPSPSRSSDGWHHVDDFPEPAPRSRLAEQGASTPDSLPRTPSRISSEPLYDGISTEGSSRARSETTTSSPRPPTHHARASPEIQLSQQGRLHTGRGVADEHELVGHALDTLLIDEGARKQQEVEQEQNEGNTEDENEGPQQEMNVVAPVVTAERADGSSRLANRRQSLPNLLNSSEPAEDDEKKPRLAKRKQLSSSHDGPTRKKRRRTLQKSSSCQHRPLSKPHPHHFKSHSPLNQRTRVATSSSAEGRLPSLAPSMPQSIDIQKSLSDSNLSLSSIATPPTLIEITFRPHSVHYYSFMAKIRDDSNGRGVSLAQLAQLIATTGHVGNIADFTIKPIEHHSYLLTGLSRHTSFQPSSGGGTVSTAKVDCIYRNTMRPQSHDSRAVDGGALESGNEPLNSDDDSGLSDSDPESSSDDDKCSSGDEQGLSSTSKHSRWDGIDEQRLLAYKKEDKSWGWIFKKFPGRTPAAVRTRWTIVQRRVK